MGTASDVMEKSMEEQLEAEEAALLAKLSAAGTPPAEEEKTAAQPPVVEPEKASETAEAPALDFGQPEAPQGGETAPLEAESSEYKRLMQKHSVLEGKYNAEVPRLAEENKSLKAELAELKALKSETAEALKKGAIPSGLRQRLVAKFPDLGEDIAGGLGDELAGFVDERIAEATGTVRRDVDAMRQEAEQNRAIRYRNALSLTVREAHPTASIEALNADKEFHKWLAVEDGHTGFSRHQNMLKAHNAMNTDRVAKYFKAYLTEKGSAPPKPEVKGPENFIEPGSTKLPGPPGDAAPKRIWTIAEISAAELEGEITSQEARKLEEELEAGLVRRASGK